MAVGQTAVLPKTGGGTFTAKANDVVRYSPAANTYSLVFRGDGVGLSGATIDGLAVIPNTEDLILSFTASRTVNGVGTVHGEDLVAFHPTSLGTTTQGTFRLFFDGSDIGLTADRREHRRRRRRPQRDDLLLHPGFLRDPFGHRPPHRHRHGHRRLHRPQPSGASRRVPGECPPTAPDRPWD